jgi:hypothetical protein
LDGDGWGGPEMRDKGQWMVGMGEHDAKRDVARQWSCCSWIQRFDLRGSSGSDDSLVCSRTTVRTEYTVVYTVVSRYCVLCTRAYIR